MNLRFFQRSTPDRMPLTRTSRILWRIRRDVTYRLWRLLVQTGNAPSLSRRDTENLVGSLSTDMLEKRRARFRLFDLSSVPVLSEDYPSETTTVIDEAERILNQEFRILRASHIRFDSSIPWHSDFHEDFEWHPGTFFKDVRVLEKKEGSDIKVPWELSRFQFLTWLAQASLLTSDRKYVEKGKKLIIDWLEKNPIGVGVNWACTMDVAIRAANWIQFLVMLPEEVIDDEFSTQIQISLLEHGLFIVNNLEFAAVRGNHYLSDLVGLYYIAVFFRETAVCRPWIDFAAKEIQREIQYQVYDDGVDFEDSVTYHRLVLELFAAYYVVSRYNQIEVPDGFSARLKKMFEFVEAVRKPDGLVPLRGDNDSGRFLIFLPARPDADLTYLEDMGAMLFADPQLKNRPRIDYETRWLCTADDSKRFKALSEGAVFQSRAFPDAGIYIMRHERDYAFIACRRNGLAGYGCHTHNDKLSLILALDGVELFSDPGQYTYTTSEEMRNRFRSSASHNIIMINGEEQIPFEPQQYFRLADVADAQCLDWREDEEEIIFRGEHTAYARLNPSVIVRRHVHYKKRLGSLLIKDQIIARGSGQLNDIQASFILPPDISIAQLGTAGAMLTGQGKQFRVHFTAPVELTLNKEKADYSRGYGIIEPTNCLRLKTEAVTLETDESIEIITKIEPV